MRRQATKIASIFGQIEGIVALEMAAEKKITLIPQNRIPPTVLYNEAHVKAVCAVIFSPSAEREFDKRVALLKS